jgi:hypothetical protein
MARFGDFDQYLDNAGDPLAEGKLYFYESGTTTPKTTYSDVNNSIPNTNPVLLSAAGRQPNIFFDGVAKVILTDNDDVQLIVRDPVGETATDFGDQWVATKIYNATDVVLGSDGTYYRSLINGNQNNNPVTTTGNWTLLYSVEWNAGITYQVGAVVTYGGEQYQSLQGSNLNQNPSTASSYWVLLSFAWLATATYAEDQNAVGTDGILYTSLQNSNTGNDPASSPAYWVGTSAAAAASAVAAAASAAAALVSENAAAADAIATAADVVQTGLDAAATAADAIATAADRVQTGLDAAATAADVILTNADAVATAADRVQTGLDAAATSADAIATAADRVQTGLDVIATNADAIATAADAIATAADVVQTGLDVVATSADVVQTGLDVTAAAGSASAASGSASAAAASAVSAAASYDAFDDRYLGDKASDPTLDNDGNALLTGALYFNTTSDVMKVYDGSAWNIAAISSASPTFTGTVTADGLSLGDNDKATFGAGNDLEIYHDGANNYVDGVSGAVFVRGSRIDLRGANNELMLVGNQNGSLISYYDNSAKLATTSTGIDVTGTATMDGLTVNGQVFVENGNTVRVERPDGLTWSEMYMQAGGSGGMTFLNNNSDGFEFKYTAGGDKLTINNGGDISFYEDTGTTPKFFWDASAESLGVGTVSPARTLHLAANTNCEIRLEAVGQRHYAIASNSSNAFVVNDVTAGAERLRIDSSGNLLVGTTSFPSGSTTGFGFQGSSDYAYFARSGGESLNLDRHTSDGDIAVFRKDGTTVGSIGARFGDLYLGTGDVGITFTDSIDSIRPVDPSTNDLRDAAIDIGTGTARFKDLYLSGDIVINDQTNGATRKILFDMKNTGGAQSDFSLQANNGNFLFYSEAAATERARIDSSGNLLVGTTSVPSASVAGFAVRDLNYGWIHTSYDSTSVLFA